jgi:hypothetical protein
MRTKKKTYYCGNHVFYAWTLSNGVTRAIRRCTRCDYEQGRAEYFFKREKAIERMKGNQEIVNKYEHISRFI